MDYRLAFADTGWEPCLEGTARLKRIASGGKVFRLVELTPATRHPGWCETGHLGFVVEGRMEVEFDRKTVRLSKGDALAIPAGVGDRHRPRALSARVLMFLIEDEA